MELNGAKILYTIHTNIPLLGDFKYHIFINMKTTGCIQDHYIEAIFRSMFYSGFCNVHRADLIAHGKYRNIYLFTIDLQLFDRSRTIYVTGN